MDRRAIPFTDYEWGLLLTAARGFRQQLLNFTGPRVAVGNRGAQAAVRAIGDVQWIIRDIERGLARESSDGGENS